MQDPVDQPLSILFRGTQFERFIPILAAKKVTSAIDLLVRCAELGLSGAETSALAAAAGRCFLPSMDTPLSLPSVRRLSWGCSLLDPLWGGGLLLSGLLEFAGAAGSGKTQLALWLLGAALCEEGAGAVYVCTEGEFPAKRFCQMRHQGLDSVAACSRVVVERASTFGELWSVVSQRLPLLIARTRARLIVIDSIGALRSEYDKNEMGPNTDHLWQLGQRLKWLNDAYGVGVIVLNQVSADLNAGGEAVKASLGLVWSNCVNTRVMVSKDQRPTSEGTISRRMRIELCPYLPNFEVHFEVTTEGIRGLE